MIAKSKNDTTTDLIPLCVDLDGTLVKSDTLWEALFVMLRRRPLDALLELSLAAEQPKRQQQRIERATSYHDEQGFPERIAFDQRTVQVYAQRN